MGFCQLAADAAQQRNKWRSHLEHQELNETTASLQPYAADGTIQHHTAGYSNPKHGNSRIRNA
jgi:hypothetical protein